MKKNKKTRLGQRLIKGLKEAVEFEKGKKKLRTSKVTKIVEEVMKTHSKTLKKLKD